MGLGLPISSRAKKGSSVLLTDYEREDLRFPSTISCKIVAVLGSLKYQDL